MELSSFHFTSSGSSWLPLYIYCLMSHPFLSIPVSFVSTNFIRLVSCWAALVMSKLVLSLSPFFRFAQTPYFPKEIRKRGQIAKAHRLWCSVRLWVKLLKCTERFMECQFQVSLFILGLRPILSFYFSVTGCLCYSCVSWSLYSLAYTLKKSFDFFN